MWFVWKSYMSELFFSIFKSGKCLYLIRSMQASIPIQSFEPSKSKPQKEKKSL